MSGNKNPEMSFKEGYVSHHALKKYSVNKSRLTDYMYQVNV